MTAYIKNWISSATLALLAVCISIPAHAGALLSDTTENTAPLAKKQSTPIGTAVSGAGNVTPIISAADVPQKMSCWQYGKLIFEHTVVAPKDKIKDMRLLQNPETGEKMLLFDFKTAFCLIK